MLPALCLRLLLLAATLLAAAVDKGCWLLLIVAKC